MTVPVPTRISQLAFTADEQFLIVSAESGGGLAVYEVQALSQGSSQPAFELSTSGESIRQLVPNPMPELAALCAIVTTNGNLLMANLEEKQLASGANGPVLRNQVTCASWSTKGKQLVAGRADGTVHQMTPDGTDKGQIPKPPTLGDCHGKDVDRACARIWLTSAAVESITWIENHLFLVIHQATNGQDKPVYHIIARKQQAGAAPTFTFQHIADPVEPFVSEKTPHHSILRLHQFPPNLEDLLIVASTAIQDIGLMSRSKTPLASDVPAEAITNVFTTTELADDSRRAQLPMTEDLQDTFPVGVALDLSGKDKVYKPIPTDEMDESPGPLPGLWVLSNEGVLCAWWIVYNESIRNGTVYPGLAAAQQSSAQQPAAPAFGTPKSNPFGASASSTPAFGAPSTSTPSAFGAPSTATPTPAFGGPSVLGAKPNPWAAAAPTSGGAAPAFGSSSFGSTPASAAPKFGSPSLPFGAKAATPAFGQPSAALGSKPSPWAAGSTATATPAFGQSGFGTAGVTNTNKVFGSSTSTPSGGFSAFASKGGFGSVAANTGNTTSVFGQPPGTVAPVKEVSMDTETAFPPPGSKPQGGSTFGSPFVLGTTFKADPKSANDNEPEQKSGGGSFFGGGFGLSLNEPAKVLPSREAKDEDMDATTPALEKPKSIFETTTPAVEKPKSIFDSTTPATEKPKSIFASSTTPTTTPAPPKFGFPTASAPPAGSSIFGATKPATSPAVNPFAPKPFANPFAPSAPSYSAEPESPQSEESWASSEIKEEEDEGDDKENLANIPEAPLPPDPTSKAPYPFGGSSSSSARSDYSPVTASSKAAKAVDNAPLPPGFLAKPAKKEEDTAVPEDAPLPPDFTKTPVKGPEEAPLPPDFLAKGTPKDTNLAIPAAPDSAEEGEFSEEEENEGAEEEEGDEEAQGEEEEGEADEEEEEEEREEEDDEEGTEGSGIDVAQDLSPPESGLGGYTPQGSFTGMGGSTFSSHATNETEKPRPLFGEISKNAPPLFPKAVPPSPRSPSPVRTTLPPSRGAIPPNLLRPEASRSVSAPGMASQILGRKGFPSQPQPQAHAQSQASFHKAAKSSISLDPNVDLQRKLRAKKEEEAQLLRDPEDEGIQQILQSAIEPTLVIDEFVTVDSQLPEVSSREKEPIHVQCEALWRDINRMLDRIGLNSRALQSFIKGHTTLNKEGGRTKEDLDHPDDWVLVEAEDLGLIVEIQLTRELEEGRVKDVDETKDAIREMLRDISKLRAKQEDMHKIIMAHVDPEQASIVRSLPLNAEQATQQNELRRAYANVTQLLAEAEESLTLLRAKMASAGGASNRKTGAPTVDAVIRTINKLTTMAEKRSVDIDVLETQMRRLRVGTGSPAPRSREGSPFVAGTPSHRRSQLMSPGTNMRDSFASSVASYGARGTPPRKKMSMFTEEERKALQSKQGKRKAKLGMLREALQRVGPQVSTLQDDV